MKKKRSKAPKKRVREEKAKSVSILVNDFSSFSVCDTALWHYTHLFSPIPIPSTNNLNNSSMDNNISFRNRSSTLQKMSVLEVSLFPHARTTETSLASLERGTHNTGAVLSKTSVTSKDTGTRNTPSLSTDAASPLKPKADPLSTVVVGDGDIPTTSTKTFIPFTNQSTATEHQHQHQHHLLKGEPQSCLLVPETQLAFVYQTYNVVVAIDISSSVLNTALVRESSGHCNRSTILHGVLLDEVRDALQQLIVPMSSSINTKTSTTSNNNNNTVDTNATNHFEPDILVTIATVGSSPVDMLRPILKSFKLKLNKLDEMMDEMITRMVALIQHDTNKRKHGVRLDYGRRKVRERRGGSGVDVASVLESCLLIHDTMPSKGCPSILFVSDGVMMLPSAGSYDNIVLRLTRKGIACHTIRIRGADLGNTAWGCVSDPDTMAYLAHATGGSFFDLATETNALRIFRGGLSNMNVQQETDIGSINGNDAGHTGRRGSLHLKPTAIQRAVLWRYSPLAPAPLRPGMQRFTEQQPAVSGVRTARALQAIDHPFPWMGQPPPSPMCCERVSEYQLSIDLPRILECRAREGFVVETLTVEDSRLHVSSASSKFSGSGTSFKLSMRMKWHPEVDIRYKMTSVKQQDTSSNLALNTHTLDKHLVSSTAQSSSSNKNMTNRKGRLDAGSTMKVAIEVIASMSFIKKFKSAAETVARNKQSKSSPSSTTLSPQSSAGEGKPDSIKITGPFLLHRLLSSMHEVDKVLMHLSSSSSVSNIREAAATTARERKNNVSSSQKRQDASKQLGGKPLAFFVTLGRLSTLLWSRWFRVKTLEVITCGMESGSVHSNSSSLGSFSNADNRRSTPEKAAKGFRQLLSAIDRWCSKKIGTRVYVKLLASMVEEDGENATANVGGTNQESKDNRTLGNSNVNSDSEISMKASTSFCMVRIMPVTDRMVRMDVAFYATGAAGRDRIMKNLHRTLMLAGGSDLSTLSSVSTALSDSTISSVSTATTVSNNDLTVLNASISRVMHSMRYFPGLSISDNNLKENDKNTTDVALSPQAIKEIMTESWLASYLWKHVWHYECTSGWFAEAVVRLIIESRERDGFLTVQTFGGGGSKTRGRSISSTPNPDTNHRGRMLIKSNSNEATVNNITNSSVLQYVIWTSSKNPKRVSICILMEPFSCMEVLKEWTHFQEMVKAYMYSDFKIVQTLVTFNRLKQHTNGEILKGRSEADVVVDVPMCTHWSDVALASSISKKQELPPCRLRVLMSLGGKVQDFFPIFAPKIFLKSGYSYEENSGDEEDEEKVNQERKLPRKKTDYHVVRPVNISLFKLLVHSIAELSDYEVQVNEKKTIDAKIDDHQTDESNPNVTSNRYFIKNISNTTIFVSKIVPFSEETTKQDLVDGNSSNSGNNKKKFRRTMTDMQYGTPNVNMSEHHSHNAFCVSFVECHRDDASAVIASPSTSKKSSTFSFTTTFATQHPKRHRSRQDVVATRKFRKRLQLIHAQSFARVIFWGLRQRYWMSPTDFSIARASCVEVTLDIDATLFREVQLRRIQDALDQTDSNEAIVLLNEKSIDHDISSILGQYFTGIIEPSKVVQKNGKHYFYHGRYAQEQFKGNSSAGNNVSRVAGVAGADVPVAKATFLSRSSNRATANTQRNSFLSSSSVLQEPLQVHSLAKGLDSDSEGDGEDDDDDDQDEDDDATNKSTNNINLENNDNSDGKVNSNNNNVMNDNKFDKSWQSPFFFRLEISKTQANSFARVAPVSASLETLLVEPHHDISNRERDDDGGDFMPSLTFLSSSSSTSASNLSLSDLLHQAGNDKERLRRLANGVCKIRLVCITLANEKFEKRGGGVSSPSIDYYPDNNDGRNNRGGDGISSKSSHGGMYSSAFLSLPQLHRSIMLKMRRRILSMISRRILNSLLNIQVTNHTLLLARQHLLRLPHDEVIHIQIPIQLVRVTAPKNVDSTTTSSSSSSSSNSSSSSSSSSGSTTTTTTSRSNKNNGNNKNNKNSKNVKNRNSNNISQVENNANSTDNSNKAESFELLTLREEMKRSPIIALREVGAMFYIENKTTNNNLKHWAIVQLKELESSNVKDNGTRTSTVSPPSRRHSNFRSNTTTNEISMQHLIVTLSVYYPAAKGDKSGSNKVKKYKRNLLNVVHRTNQLLLLHSLHETRSCPNVLYHHIDVKNTIPRSKSRSLGMSLDDFNAYRKQYRSFRVGNAKGSKGEISQFTNKNSILFPDTSTIEKEAKTLSVFECPVVYMLHLPLYERILPSFVLNTIGQSSLLPFAVENRKNMFVYRDQQGHIHYILLTTTPSKTGKDQHTLVLTAHGVDQPGTEITKDLRSMLQSKINATALTTISNLILRNPTFKISQSDLHFVCVMGKNHRRGGGNSSAILPFVEMDHKSRTNVHEDTEISRNITNDDESKYLIDIAESPPINTKETAESNPDRELSARLPTVVTDVKHVLRLLSKSAESLLHVLRLSSEAAISLGKHDLALVYNYSPSGTSVSASIGRGVAIISIEVISENIDTTDTWPHLWTDDLVLIKENTRMDDETVEEEDDDDGEDGAKLNIKVWAAGRIDVSLLVDKLEIFVHQAVHMYALETHYWKAPIHKCLGNLNETWMDPIIAVMDSALTLGASNVFRIQSQQALPSWALYEIAEELTAAFSRLEPSMQPVLLINYNYDATKDNDSMMSNNKYEPYAVTGSSLKIDEANKIVQEETKEDLDSHEMEEKMVQTEREKPGMVVMRGSPSFVTVGGIDFHNGQKDKTNSHKYMMLSLTDKRLSLRTYGVSVTKINQFGAIISKLLSWARSRTSLLQQVLHQKMGLFAHSTTALSPKTTITVEGGGRHVGNVDNTSTQMNSIKNQFNQKSLLANKRKQSVNINNSDLGLSNSMRGGSMSSMGILSNRFDHLRPATQQRPVSQASQTNRQQMNQQQQEQQQKGTLRNPLSAQQQKKQQQSGILSDETTTSIATLDNQRKTKMFNRSNIDVLIQNRMPPPDVVLNILKKRNRPEEGDDDQQKDADTISSSGTLAHMGTIGSAKDFKTFNRLRAIAVRRNKTLDDSSGNSIMELLKNRKVPKSEESRDSMNAKFGSLLRGVQSNQLDKLRKMTDVCHTTDPLHRHGQHFQRLAESQLREDIRVKQTRDIRTSLEKMSQLSRRSARSAVSRFHMEERDGKLRSSMSDASRILYMMRAPLFFEKRDADTNIANEMIDDNSVLGNTFFEKVELLFAKYLKQLFPNHWIQESMDKLSMGLVVSGRVVTLRVSCHCLQFMEKQEQPLPERVAEIFDPEPTATSKSSKNNKHYQYILGCDIYMMEPRRGAISLSKPVANEIARLKHKIKLFGFVVNHSGSSALSALSNDNDVDVLYRLRNFRNYYRWNSIVFPRKLQTHTVVQRYLPMDVTKLSLTSVQHGIEITLESLIKYMSQPERCASIYGCSGRNHSNGDCFIVFCPMQGTLSTASVVRSKHNNKNGRSRNNKGEDGLEIFLVFGHNITLLESSATNNTMKRNNSQRQSNSRRIGNDHTLASKPWEKTRLWIQHNLSKAAANMLRDGLWSLARSQNGLNKEQFSHLSRYVLKVSVSDIDHALMELFDVDSNFNDTIECQKLLSYIKSFYPSNITTTNNNKDDDNNDNNLKDNDDNITVQVSAEYQCSGNRLLIAALDQALDISFINGKLNVMLWRRLKNAPVRVTEMNLIRSFALQFGGWLWNESNIGYFGE